MGGGIFIDDGTVILSEVTFTNNRAVGGDGWEEKRLETTAFNSHISEDNHHFRVNRGATSEINGIGINKNSIIKIFEPNLLLISSLTADLLSLVKYTDLARSINF